MGGATPGAARRAARLGDGFLPVDGSLWAEYEAACAELGKEAGSPPPVNGPPFVHVADDPDEAWAKIAPHALHETNSYGEWLTSAAGIARYTPTDDADALRAGGGYAVVTPEQCVALARSTGSLVLHPLMGGLPPDLAWESLELVAAKVLPELRGPS
jgi:alkanesulfonate monooxygenase SsuD/methylene tetrahydromethanopterin reductase-like flavin-dependent oxidoreductase (luciferase family)